MCIFGGPGIGLGVSQEPFGPRLQRGPAATFGLIAPAGQTGKEAADPLPGLRRGRLCTRAFVPKHWFPVTSSLTQPQTASSALKSGLYPGRFTSCSPSPGVLRYSRTASPRCSGAVRRSVAPDHVHRPRMTLTQLSQEGGRGFAEVSELLFPSIPPPRSLGTLPGSNWPSRHGGGCWNPPMPALPSAPICPVVQRRPGNAPRRQRQTCSRIVEPRPIVGHSLPRRPPVSFRQP